MLYQNSFNELEEYITPSEIIEFLYCPRFTYFMKCLSIKQYEENRFKVQIGREKHTNKSNSSVLNVRKRIGGVSKEQEKYLISKKYGLKGIVDEVYALDDGSYAPLDYKFAEYKEKDFETYKIQMILYSLMIEEIYNTNVNKKNDGLVSNRLYANSSSQIYYPKKNIINNTKNILLVTLDSNDKIIVYEKNNNLKVNNILE